MRKGTFRQSALIEIRIVAGHPWHSGIGPGADRMIGVRVLGAADAADEMIGHFRHRHAFGQSERQWLDTQMTSWFAGGAFDLEEFLIPGEIAESNGARWWSKGSTPALGLVPVPLQLDEFGQPHDQAGEFLRRRSAGKLPLAVFNGAAAGPMG